MSDRALEVINLQHAFGTVEVLRRVEFSVDRNEFVAIVGPSGCGKTTLLSLLSGYEQPLAGEVIRNGAVRTVFQRDGLFPWLTCAENIRLGLRNVRSSPLAKGGFRGVGSASPKADDLVAMTPLSPPLVRGEDSSANVSDQVEELLTLIRLNGFADRYPHQLSGGMRQLVEVARAMAGNTDILLMDEPFSALDYLTRLRMRGDLLRLLAEKPRTVVFVTHDIEEACQLADRVMVLSPRPARISLELRVEATRPRAITNPKVALCMQQVFQAMGLGQNGACDKQSAAALSLASEVAI
jgi:ABC-type nitrate/sulfonate/bicarbonate transport system ATPase subunit